MKRGQLGAVLIIVLLVAAVGAFFIFSQKRAGKATLMRTAADITATEISSDTARGKATCSCIMKDGSVKNPGCVKNCDNNGKLCTDACKTKFPKFVRVTCDPNLVCT